MSWIHDVSTDADDAPRFVALRALRLQCENGVLYSGLRGDEHRRRYPDIAPAVYPRPHVELFRAALATANALGWHIVAAVKSEGRIEATARTRWLRFKDDVVIRICEQNGGTRLDIRSASRIGRSDLGANARRIRSFLRELNSHLKSNS